MRLPALTLHEPWASLYPQYGCPVFKAVCEAYDFPIPEGEDLVRMAQGLPCREGCRAGCGG